MADAARAYGWLGFGSTRKISKSNCMTFSSVGADKTVAKLEEGVKNKPMAETLQEDEVTDAAFAQWWLDYGITRKITKRNCMTFPHRWSLTRPWRSWRALPQKRHCRK